MKHTGLSPREAKQERIEMVKDVIDRWLTAHAFDDEVFIPHHLLHCLMKRSDIKKYVFPLYPDWNPEFISRPNCAMIGSFEQLEEGYLFKA